MEQNEMELGAIEDFRALMEQDELDLGAIEGF